MCSGIASRSFPIKFTWQFDSALLTKNIPVCGNLGTGFLFSLPFSRLTVRLDITNPILCLNLAIKNPGGTEASSLTLPLRDEALVRSSQLLSGKCLDAPMYF